MMIVLGIAYAPALAAEEPVFRSYEDVPLLPAGAPTVEHGTVTPRDAFKALFYYVTGGKFCSAAFIGAKTLLTSAHCVHPDQPVTVYKGKAKATGTCLWAKGWPLDNSADYAICRLSEDFGVRFESINPDPAKVRKGDKITLAGFGCDPFDTSPDNDIQFRTGPAPISEVPTGTSPFILVDGEAALCVGDSGGPGFRLTGGPDAPRTIMGVNAERRVGTVSALASTSSPKALELFARFSGNDHLICGYDALATGCR